MYEHGPFKSDLKRFLESIYRFSNCFLTASSPCFPEKSAAGTSSCVLPVAESMLDEILDVDLSPDDLLEVKLEGE